MNNVVHLNYSTKKKDDLNLKLVHQAEIQNLDKNIINLIKRGLSYQPTHSVTDVLADLLIGKCQLWLATNNKKIDGVVITVINDFPQSTSCLIWLCAGNNSKKYIYLIKKIEDWAKEQGCQTISLEGRLGWKKLLRDYQDKIFMEKVL